MVQHFLFKTLLLVAFSVLVYAHSPRNPSPGQECISLNHGWMFWRSEANPDGVIYDWRPDLENLTNVEVLEPYILPSGNQPSWPYVLSNFDDSQWQNATLPHDCVIAGPFYTGEEGSNPVNGGMGRLPVQGVGWYRLKLDCTEADLGRVTYLDIDGAMSYAMVWLNGHLVGGWPYGYNSFRLDLTPYVEHGSDNILALRLDNPTDSARWYPGAGLYRNVWLTSTHPIHIAQDGTFITSSDVSASSATLDLAVTVQNKGARPPKITLMSDVYTWNHTSRYATTKLGSFPEATIVPPSSGSLAMNTTVTIPNPRLWRPLPETEPALYVAVTRLYDGNTLLDSYNTTFGIRSLEYKADEGIFVNGDLIKLQGVNQHHDLGALGAAWNTRAAGRQLEILRDLGCNAIRMAHNPPAAELLDLTDRMGFMVIDEIFDSWMFNKTANDFHIIFPDWHEPDLRSFVRRDRTHPSIIAWSYGNEVYEQYTNETGAALSATLRDIIREEDPTRLSTASITYATPEMDFPGPLEILSLNYQDAGIRDIPGYPITGIVRPPSYPLYHSLYPDKLILTSESASTLSTRGSYIFPVTDSISAPADGTTGQGADNTTASVSAYELYTADFGSSPDKVFASQARAPYVAGEFVWTGFDNIGEPTPFYSARSSYSGIIDLAGFKKDRYWLYQARWRPELKFAHVLPHWTWPERVGEVTPVHVFTSADEAELWVNSFEYRFRWDGVVYEPGEVYVRTWKDGEFWAEETVRTTGDAAALRLTADRDVIAGDGLDLAFLTAEVVDERGDVVPIANNTIDFSVMNGGGGGRN
ncbi:putative glycoside hydrolase, family 2, glycoside hydrolase family 2, catalytic [Septoria linicola]|nr:putative glycoside hydrolase, family 2, glycoside hydrolase family 2, catalytic [Septoria linicola]